MTACIAKSGWAITNNPRRVNQKRCPCGEAGNVAALENVKQRLLEFSNVDDIYFEAICLIHGRWIKSTPDLL